MSDNGHDEFGRFILHRKADLKRIAYKTRGEYQLADVENTAWLTAQDMRDSKGIPVDFLDQDYQDRLLAYVYQALLRYADTRVRYAVRLDHGMDDDEAGHPLMRTLASDDGRDPLAELILREEAVQPADPHHSLASAYACLLRKFDNRLQAVAKFLLISVSQTRRHCTRAEWLARHQCPLPLNHAEGSSFRLGPWRKFRFQRIPIQLELPFVFDAELALDHFR